MREDAIRFVESVYKWRHDHEDSDKKTASELAAELAEIEASKLPSGPYGLAMLQVRKLAYGWYTAPSDGMNDEELFQWLGGKDLAGLLEQLVLHDGPQSPEPPVLLDNDSGLLEAMLSMGATADAPCSSREILGKANWISEGKRAFKRLKKYGFVGAKKGVGYYLTQAGIKRAKKLCE
jgi:hypothetical protein